MKLIPNPKTLALPITLCLAAGGIAQAPATAPRTVELAICLDVSGSMDGLLDAARQNLWTIVNDLALASPAPKLRVALLTFGHSDYDPARGWVAVQTGFTDDLDLVSQKLFALATNGGEEYVARVVRTALSDLDWQADTSGLRMIVVAGNEAATQDPEFQTVDVSKAAIERGILVNTIYCGPENDELAPAWREVALRAEGAFASIDQNQATVTIVTPFDAKLVALGTGLNATYVPYGAAWLAAQANQIEQDRNAEGVNVGVAVQRAVCKASSNYCNTAWDLVDALREKTVVLAEVKRTELPEALRGLDDDALRTHVEAMGKQRVAIQAEVSALNAQRVAFVTAEMKRRAVDQDGSFEFAVRRSVRAQAEAKGFTFRPAVVLADAPIAVDTPDIGAGK